MLFTGTGMQITEGLNPACLPKVTPSVTQVGRNVSHPCVMLRTAQSAQRVIMVFSFLVPVWYSVCPLNVESFEIRYLGNLALRQSSVLTSGLGVVALGY